ncbi:hypothetical protein [Allobaculum sp. Allo2]|uniref:hypothetical protein n=1 Tax=Allobaculum sp. Allo2 TaxID=2853432 RepID=UPI001F625809|nr:hypothetical protein [Allobaculum sp. Allo2]UNT94307.1 hypothetical protein KWG61_06855 [Allobaculum sp. Allo2]
MASKRVRPDAARLQKTSASSSKRQTGKTSVFSLNTFWICVLIIFSWVICTMVLFSLGLVGSFLQEVLQLLVGSFSYGLLIFSWAMACTGS